MGHESSTPNPLLMEEIPQTLDQLNAKVAELFHCMNGPPVAYFEIPLEERPEYHDRPVEPQVERLVYVTLGWSTSEIRSSSVDAKLVMAMLEPFLDARRQLDERSGYALLFWRRPPTIEQLDMTDDSGRPLGTKLTRITCRVVIPGADLSRYAHRDGERLQRL